MNDLFVESLRESKLVSQVASEEMGEVKDFGRGRFSVVLDPLDGSSNVKSNNIFGTIFGIFDRIPLPARGSDLFAAGYLIYGPATTFGDFNQILHYGGFFAYPAQADKPAGKYRLQFESNPIAFIAETAGGAGTTGAERILDVAPTSIDQTIPTYVGNQDLVDRFRSQF